MFSRVNLMTMAAEQPGPLPLEIENLSIAALADLSKALDPVPVEFDGVGFWPVSIELAEFDRRARTPDGTYALALDEADRTISAVPRLRDLTPAEAASLPAIQPRTLGRLQFIVLAQTAGGMTDEMLVDAQANPAFAAFWIKYQMAEAVDRDDPITLASLDALAAGGYLPNGKAAVIAAWPTA